MGASTLHSTVSVGVYCQQVHCLSGGRFFFLAVGWLALSYLIALCPLRLEIVSGLVGWQGRFKFRDNCVVPPPVEASLFQVFKCSSLTAFVVR